MQAETYASTVRFEPSSYWGRHLEGSAAASAQYEELCGDTQLVRAFGVARQTERVHPKFCVSIRHLHYTPHAVQAGGVHVCWVQASS